MMLNLPPSVRIFLCVTPVDMRKSFDSLAGMVRDFFGEDPYSGHLFVFRSREEDKLKILYWDRDGYVIYYKRLEEGRFKLPDGSGGRLEMDATTFSMLLQGLEKASYRRQKRYTRETAGVR